MKKVCAICLAIPFLVSAVSVFAQESIFRCPGGGYTKDFFDAYKRNCLRLDGTPVRPLAAGLNNEQVVDNFGPGGQQPSGREISDIAINAAQRGTGVALLLSIPVALILLVGLVLRWFRRVNPPRPDDKLFEAAALELEGGGMNKGLWARLYSKHGGDESKTRAAYILERAKALAEVQVSTPVVEKKSQVQKSMPSQVQEPVPPGVYIVGFTILLVLISLGIVAFITPL